MHSPYQDSSLLGTCIIISVHFAGKLGSPEIFNDKIDVGVDLTDQGIHLIVLTLLWLKVIRVNPGRGWPDRRS